MTDSLHASTLPVAPVPDSGQPLDPTVTSATLLSPSIVSVLLDQAISTATLEVEANYEVWVTGSPTTTYTPASPPSRYSALAGRPTFAQKGSHRGSSRTMAISSETQSDMRFGSRASYARSIQANA